ncbi:MAG: 16S rRNA (cytidine(1402)-2'-O)-methyltransferase [Candidatus Doudnabacteria bacterium]|nr:16S rRNA (cytidine(1402)-2'-O)-methyltransferase [Candidatus Doudnabacteria bacterium]
MLYVVATPIGNLGDITLRAIEMLRKCDFIIAENPGYSKRLLQYIDGLPIGVIPASEQESSNETSSGSRISSDSSGMTAKKEIVQFAEHNEQQILKELTRRLIKEDACLITDAGTPGISDPGFRLVRECVKNSVAVVPIPGASAAIAALSASGLPTDKFMFLGFLQKTATKTVEALSAAATAEATAIFYESPERILKTLSYIANAFPASQVVAARELTKMHEEFIHGDPLSVIHQLKQKPAIKGEFTILISFK